MNELSREDQILLITEMIADIWGRYPELRLGQLIVGAVEKYGRPHYDMNDLFMAEDLPLIDALTDYDEYLQERTNELADHTG